MSSITLGLFLWFFKGRYIWQKPSALVIIKKRLWVMKTLIIHKKGFRLDIIKMDVQGFQISISIAGLLMFGRYTVIKGVKIGLGYVWHIFFVCFSMFLDMYKSHTHNANPPKLGKEFNFGTHQTAGRQKQGVLVCVGACEGNRLDLPSVLAVSCDFPV